MHNLEKQKKTDEKKTDFMFEKQWNITQQDITKTFNKHKIHETNRKEIESMINQLKDFLWVDDTTVFNHWVMNWLTSVYGCMELPYNKELEDLFNQAEKNLSKFKSISSIIFFKLNTESKRARFLEILKQEKDKQIYQDEMTVLENAVYKAA